MLLLVPRCIQRDPVVAAKVRVTGPLAKIQGGRGPEFATVHTVPVGTEGTVRHREAGWAWIDAPKSVIDRSGSEPRAWECTIGGWIESGDLAPPSPG